MTKRSAMTSILKQLYKNPKDLAEMLYGIKPMLIKTIPLLTMTENELNNDKTTTKMFETEKIKRSTSDKIDNKQNIKTLYK